jgi:hypothetical protein
MFGAYGFGQGYFGQGPLELPGAGGEAQDPDVMVMMRPDVDEVVMLEDVDEIRMDEHS